jgi:hypothetical protein
MDMQDWAVKPTQVWSILEEQRNNKRRDHSTMAAMMGPTDPFAPFRDTSKVPIEFDPFATFRDAMKAQSSEKGDIVEMCKEILSEQNISFEDFADGFAGCIEHSLEKAAVFGLFTWGRKRAMKRFTRDVLVHALNNMKDIVKITAHFSCFAYAAALAQGDQNTASHLVSDLGRATLRKATHWKSVNMGEAYTNQVAKNLRKCSSDDDKIRPCFSLPYPYTRQDFQ